MELKNNKKKISYWLDNNIAGLPGGMCVCVHNPIDPNTSRWHCNAGTGETVKAKSDVQPHDLELL